MRKVCACDPRTSLVRFKGALIRPEMWESHDDAAEPAVQNAVGERDRVGRRSLVVDLPFPTNPTPNTKLSDKKFVPCPRKNPRPLNSFAFVDIFVISVALAGRHVARQGLCAICWQGIRWVPGFASRFFSVASLGDSKYPPDALKLRFIGWSVSLT